MKFYLEKCQIIIILEFLVAKILLLILDHGNTNLNKELLNAIFLGYALGYKTYRLYELQNKAIIISRNVVFYENNFPFANRHNTSMRNHSSLPILTQKIPENSSQMLTLSHEIPSPTQQTNLLEY